MANAKWTLFLEQNSFKNEIINSSSFIRCDVDSKNNQWQLIVRFSNVVPLKDLLRFYEQASIYFKPVQITKTKCTISYDSLSNFTNYYKEYYSHFLTFFNKQRCGLLDNHDIDYDYDSNTIYIITENDNDYIKQFLKEMESVFEKHFFKINFNVRLDNTKLGLKDKIEHEQKVETETNSKRLESYVEQQIIEKKRNVTYRTNINFDVVRIIEIPTSSEELYQYKNHIGDTKFNVMGEIDAIEIKDLKRNDLKLLSFDIIDDTSAITCKKFLNNEKDLAEAKSLKNGDYLNLSGVADYDQYIKDVILKIYNYKIVPKPLKKLRQDNASEKRVEFHIHSKMSNLDGLATVAEIIEQVESFGHEGFAITDFNALYAYPDIAKAIKGKKIKPVFGLEFGLADEKKFVTVQTQNDMALTDATYVVFDLESTGLSIAYDEIIEIGAVKIKNGTIVERFDQLVKPKQTISQKITDITNITNQMVIDKPTIEQVLPEFLKFITGTVLVAHNAVFDVRMLNEKTKNLGLKQKHIATIDTLPVARYFLHDKLKKFGLDALCKYYQVELKDHHRAGQDAEATGYVFLRMLAELRTSRNIKTLCDLRDRPLKDSNLYEYIVKPDRFDILVKNQQGYKDLFKLVSLGLTEYFYKVPRLTPALIEKYRSNLLIGSGTDEGTIYETALYGSDQELDQSVKFYDYISVLPPCALVHLKDMFDERFDNVIKDVTKRIIESAKRNKKIVIATGNVHYLNHSDKPYYKILTTAKRVGGGLHRLAKYDELPDYSFLNTSEMLSQFSFLPIEVAQEIVVTNTNKLLSLIEEIKPFPDSLYSLSDDCFAKSLNVASTKEEVRRIVSANLTKQYGDNPHPIIKERVEFELKTIIKNNYAPIYYIAHLLVKDSVSNGYIVGSRGSVGSSIVATLLEITEVNPLPPHYYCPQCGYQFFKKSSQDETENLNKDEALLQRQFTGITSGFDLPIMMCPHCHQELKSDGHDIPFATFLGFAGDKVPDIDLNFSGEYQKNAHDYVRNLLGKDYTFRAGTIQTAKDKTSYGYVKAYLEAEGKEMRKPHINYIAKKIEGVLRTTSQHPGGIVVVPENHTIFDVTPVQYPSDNVELEWKTSHFDYHSFEANLLKLDILGHDDPTVMKFIMDYVKAHPDEFPFSDVQGIPLNDHKVYEMFGSTSCLGIDNERIFAKIATYGLPEFGTKFVREMLEEITPKSFGELVKVSGLSHGENIWRGNSQDLINPSNPNHVKFSDIIGCRDDIMINLITNYNMEPIDAFNVMEFVRKGKQHGNYDKWLEWASKMLSAKVPKWYVDSAYKIKYLFPKAHACAYVIMALRIAWFKYYKPLLFYAAFFSKRVDQFEPVIMTSGNNAIYNRLRELKTAEKLTDIEKKLVTTLEVAIEMSERGFGFLPIDIEKSHSTDFIIEGNSLRMPFITCPGLGGACADSIIDERTKTPFKSKEDIKDRTKVNKTIFKSLEEMGTFGNLNETHVKTKTLFDIEEK